jgi:hypothetical protein
MTSQLDAEQPAAGRRMPVVFAAHGAPVLLDDDVWMRELADWAHFAPVLVAAGAAVEERPRVAFPITGFWMNGAFTKRSAQLG